MPLFEKTMVLLLTNTFFVVAFLELGFVLDGIDALYCVVGLVKTLMLSFCWNYKFVIALFG